MPQFENSKIYKLWSPQGEDIYIGSTTLSLSMRKVGHKSNFNKGGSCSSRILFEKYDDVRIELIEEFPCGNKMELNKKEGYYIRSMDCVNKHIAGRSQKEYDDEHKEQKKQYYDEHKEQKKQYREEHKEKFKKYNKEYREEHKEQKKEYNKIYYEKNKEKIKEYKKEYYEKNKDEINQKKREYYANNKSQNKYIMTQNFEVVLEPVLE